LMLCCDGLWEMVPDGLIEDILLQYTDPQAACQRLVALANEAGGDDNISVIVVNIQSVT
jgi:serine/threonine protein phosphatase PrpC